MQLGRSRLTQAKRQRLGAWSLPLLWKWGTLPCSPPNSAKRSISTNCSGHTGEPFSLSFNPRQLPSAKRHAALVTQISTHTYQWVPFWLDFVAVG